MIEARNLTKRFDDLAALDDVSFEIGDRAVYGLVGSNGSGKSTLLRLLSGIYRPDGGSICVDGMSTFDRPDLKAKIAFLGDTPYFLAQSNLNEMMRFYKSCYPTFDTAEYERLLGIFPLDSKARISTMSKGMQRQAALILNLAARPEYLLLDEAFDGLDVVMRRVLSNLIQEAVEQRNMTTIISSHNLRELEDICDHVGLLHEGKIRFNDSTDALRGQLHKVQAAFRSVPDITAFEPLKVLKMERTGSLLQMVVRGEESEIMSFISQFCPLFAECVQPTLEEMFVYELEVAGYDVKNILE